MVTGAEDQPPLRANGQSAIAVRWALRANQPGSARRRPCEWASRSRGPSHTLSQLGHFGPSNRHPRHGTLCSVRASTHPHPGTRAAMASGCPVVKRVVDELETQELVDRRAWCDIQEVLPARRGRPSRSMPNPRALASREAQGRRWIQSRPPEAVAVKASRGRRGLCG